MTAMDRKTLSLVLDVAQASVSVVQRRNEPNSTVTIHVEIIDAILNAARAHLATLPATKLAWKVTENTDPPSSRTFDHIQEALATAGIWLRQSAGDVTISRCSVPA